MKAKLSLSETSILCSLFLLSLKLVPVKNVGDATILDWPLQYVTNVAGGAEYPTDEKAAEDSSGDPQVAPGGFG